MATRKSNNSNNVTKVICQNCGAEILIPDHQFATTGIAIGKDSGMGTVVLPTAGAAHSAASATAQFGRAVQGLSQADLISAVATLMGKIEDDGYIAVDGIVRRWIPSQALSMVYYKFGSRYHGYSREGFHDALKARGYDYSWRVLLNDLKHQMELMANKDVEGYNDRNRWYNRKIAVDMANHYLRALQEAVGKMPRKNHKRRQYVRLVCHLNNGKGVHVDELGALYNEIQCRINAIANSKAPRTLYAAVERFNDMRNGIRFTPDYDDICSSFFNAYKAAGAYYTMKDLILFEGCKMKCADNGSTDFVIERYGQPKSRKFVEQEESLAALERKATAVCAAGVATNGFEMLGLLKDFLQYNNFNYEATKQAWAQQSEARKLLRAAAKTRRPRK